MLYGADIFHVNQAKSLLRRAHDHFSKAQKNAKKRNCKKVFQNIVDAETDLGGAFQHVSSAKGTAETNRMMFAITNLRETLDAFSKGFVASCIK